MDLQFSIAKEIWAHNFLLSTSFLKRKLGYCEHLRLSVISCGFLLTIEDCTVSDVLLWQKLRLLRPTSILRRRTLSNQRGLRTFLQTFMGTPLWLYCLGEDPYRWQFNGWTYHPRHKFKFTRLQAQGTRHSTTRHQAVTSLGTRHQALEVPVTRHLEPVTRHLVMSADHEHLFTRRLVTRLQSLTTGYQAPVTWHLVN